MKKNVFFKKTDNKYLPICGAPKIRYVNSNNGGGGGNNVVCVGDVGPPGAVGATGPTGESAYEIAVLNGFIGTIEQWQESLVGPTGPNPASGGLVPFFAKECSAEFNYSSPDIEYYFSFISFLGEVFTVDAEDIYAPLELEEFYDGFSAFVAPKDLIITGISANTEGLYGSQIQGVEVVLKVMLFESPPLSNIFTPIIESEMAVAPNGLSDTAIFASQTMQLNYTIAAGTKLAYAIFVQKENLLPNDDANWYGAVAGGINIIML